MFSHELRWDDDPLAEPLWSAPQEGNAIAGCMFALPLSLLIIGVTAWFLFRAF